MTTELSPELARLREALPAIVADMERHVPYASALGVQSIGTAVEVNHREQHVSQADPSQGVVLTAFNGAYLEELALGTLDAAEISRAARSFAQDVSQRVVHDGLHIDPGTPQDSHFATLCQESPADVPVALKFDRCRELHGRLAAGDPHIVNVMINYGDRTSHKVFANRARFLSQSIFRTRVMLMVVMADDSGRTEYGWHMQDGTAGFELTQVSDADMNRLTTMVRSLLTAERIEPGMYDVVTDPHVSGIIAHEAFGHGVELDMFLKGRARSQEYLGRAIASPLVTMMDDPTVPGAYGSYFFDDEGQLATPTTIIANGIFEQGLSDLTASLRLHQPHTANGRRESFQRKVYVRMSNTFFQPGDADPDAMIRDLDDGIYLTHASSGMEDPKGWGMQVTCQSAREVRDGQFTGRVFSPVIATGYVPDILTSITAVGRDLKLGGGNCGKGDKEYVPVSSGGPHLRMKVRLS
ncbi:MAG: TldD/PmbA family protein [Chloroflexi bacterium]|nr:TldD/PmbA family protein [Chloroflexota bacterium]MBU1751725.1 TldD/PmbA family protein [Chloroflexota bacterium]